MINPFTPEEIANIEGQYDRILTMLAEIDIALHEKQIEMIVVEQEFGKARLKLDIAKTQKSFLIERARNLKTILSRME